VAEDRKLFAAMLTKLDIPQPPNGLATNEEGSVGRIQKSGLPGAGCVRRLCWVVARCRLFIRTRN